MDSALWQRHTERVTTTRIQIREDFSAAPVCSHCEKEIQEIAARRVDRHRHFGRYVPGRSPGILSLVTRTA